MTIDKAISNLDKLISAFDNEMLNISEIVATDTIAIVVHRIQTKGIGKQYSKNKLPAYLFLLDESNLDTSAVVTYVKAKEKSKNKEDRMINWSDIRTAHGNQVDYVDLTYTGKMFHNLQIIKSEKSGNKYIVTIGGFTEEVRKKLFYNAQRYGDFLVLTDEEKKMALENTTELIEQMQAKYILAK